MRKLALDIDRIRVEPKSHDFAANGVSLWNAIEDQTTDLFSH